MKLSDYRKIYYKFSDKLSERVRMLSCTGIVIIWIFNFKSEGQTISKIPSELLFPLMMFILTLFLDFLHYLYATIIWGFFQWYEEERRENINEDPELSAPSVFNIPHLFCFIIKILLLFWAYKELLEYIARIWLKK